MCGLHQGHSHIRQSPIGHGFPAAGEISQDIPVPPLPESQVVIEILGGDAIEGTHKSLQLRMKPVDVLEVVCATGRLAAVKPLMRHFPMGREALV